MLETTPVVERRFYLLRLIVYVVRAAALLLLLASGLAVVASGLTIAQVPALAWVALPFGVTTAATAFLVALATAAAAEVVLVLLAIEEHARASAAAGYAAAQALQRQAEMAAALAAIAQNSRFAADDLLKAGRLLEQIADEQRRGHAALPGVADQLKELADQGRQDSARLATLETIARVLAQRMLRPPAGAPPAP